MCRGSGRQRRPGQAFGRGDVKTGPGTCRALLFASVLTNCQARIGQDSSAIRASRRGTAQATPLELKLPGQETDQIERAAAVDHLVEGGRACCVASVSGSAWRWPGGIIGVVYTRGQQQRERRIGKGHDSAHPGPRGQFSAASRAAPPLHCCLEERLKGRPPHRFFAWRAKNRRRKRAQRRKGTAPKGKRPTRKG